jgi:hypothetical protein
MTALLEKAIAEISKLPPDKQEEVASWVLAELDSESRWSKAFEGSQSELERLGEQALAEHRAGRTTELDPDKL